MNDKQPETNEKASSNEAIIEIIDMHKWFGEFHVLNNINLTVQKQERIVICGPSGSGKSTLIRCINRLEEHASTAWRNINAAGLLLTALN
jgi:general L-amino acid transport system ATP-binding protein